MCTGQSLINRVGITSGKVFWCRGDWCPLQESSLIVLRNGMVSGREAMETTVNAAQTNIQTPSFLPCPAQCLRRWYKCQRKDPSFTTPYIGPRYLFLLFVGVDPLARKEESFCMRQVAFVD